MKVTFNQRSPLLRDGSVEGTKENGIFSKRSYGFSEGGDDKKRVDCITHEERRGTARALESSRLFAQN